MSKDLYKILEIDKNANESEIKKAYRSMAKKYHPDKNSDDKESEQKFKDVAEAYEILSDPNKKARYDQMGYDGYKARNQGGGNSRDPFGFSSMFHAMRNQQEGIRRKQQHTIVQVIKLTMEENYNGADKKFKYMRVQKCTSCKGKGCENVIKCATCSGKGISINVQQTDFGMIQNAVSCADCDGRGFKITNTCTTCTGKGVLTKNDEITVDIPHSILNNEQIQLGTQMLKKINIVNFQIQVPFIPPHLPAPY